MRALVQALRQRCSASLLVANFAPPAALSTGLADGSLPRSQVSTLQRVNDAIAGLCRDVSGASVFDYARLVTEFGARRWSDPRMLFRARLPLGADALAETARALARYLRALSCPACKCLVLDLDNTLWGGVLGEDGPGGIQLGEDHPGNVYKAFQRAVLALHDRGVLLAVASKNDEAEAREVLQSHPDCVLRPDHFAAMQIHWGDKGSSLEAIAKHLSIGLDALAFFDDSPVEREWVRSRLPAVTVIDVPADPVLYAAALEDSGAFDRLSISDEDRRRTELYREESRRTALEGGAGSREQFLRALGLKAQIGPVGPLTLPRVEQLLARTNQFNLTTRRHTAADVHALTARGAVALWMRVADRFGDAGLVGVAIAAPVDSWRWIVDSFLLSCRVIGRGAESVLLGELVRRAASRGATELVGEYIPTAKNTPAAGFYEAHGFKPAGDGRRWTMAIDAGSLPAPDYIEVSVSDE